jgi:hypothetical protein
MPLGVESSEADGVPLGVESTVWCWESSRQVGPEAADAVRC